MSEQDLERFYAIGLSNEEVARGALSNIADMIRGKFLSWAEAASNGEKAVPEKKWATIKFDAGLLGILPTESRYKKSGFSQVLFLNTTAWKIVKVSPYAQNLIEELDHIPAEEVGTFISMPV